MFGHPRIRKAAPLPKKRKTEPAVEEITFDKEARIEYLTGFRKRKQARIKQAKEIAERKAREERLAIRKQLREQRKQAVEEHIKAINKILREAESAGTGDISESGSEGEWGGFSDAEDTGVPEPPPLDLEEEYIDEDKYTTVKVEAVSVDREGMHKPQLDSSSDSEGTDQEGEEGSQKGKEQVDKEASAKRIKNPTKKKKKKFRYQSKLEREFESLKQKQRAKRKRTV